MRCRPSKRLSRIITVGLAAMLGLSLLWTRPAPAEEGHQHERMPNVMEYLDRLDRPERDQDQKPAQVVEALAIKPGMHVADLGAAPGGWSWILARLHFRVFAVDNGPLAESALATGLVEHVRADGFSWRPPRAQDWLVCDMVESPRRVAARMAEWFAMGWCRHAVFNLKLPMKKRWDESRDCLAAFAEDAGRPLRIRARQLYHDREEITVFATDPSARPRQL